MRKDAATSGSNTNRYDYVGQLHNQFLETLARVAVEASERKEEGEADANDLLSSFLRENGIDTDGVSSFADPHVAWSALAEEIIDSGELLDQGKISASEHRYLNQIEGVVDQLGQELDSPALRESLVALESRISDDPELTENAKALLLSTASVARHSAEFWSREAQAGTSIWFDPADPDVAGGGTTTIAKGVVGKDVAGAAQGGAVGAAGGTPASVAGGAVVGAIRGSAGAAIKKGLKSLLGKIKGLF